MKLLSRAGSFSVSTAGGLGERLGSILSACQVIRAGGAWFGVSGPWASVCPSAEFCGPSGLQAEWVARIGGPARATSRRDLPPENLKRRGKELESGGEVTRWRDL